MRARLRELVDRYPLGVGWSEPDPTLETFSVGGCDVQLVGLCAQGAGGEVVTAGAADIGPRAMDRCYFELVERVAILGAVAGALGDGLALRDRTGRKRGELSLASVLRRDALEDRQRFSLSNGVAAHASFELACRGAWLEGVERDRVLRSWFGVAPPPRRIQRSPSLLAPLSDRYALECYRFDDPADPDAHVVVCGVFLFPVCDMYPPAWGFGAGTSISDAAERAAIECVQRLGFLQGELSLAEPPAFSATPDFHLDFYLHAPHRERLLRWLGGARREGALATSARARGVVHFADLTPPHLDGRVSVVKGVDPGRMPLVFGEGHPWITGAPDDALVHPIA